jgi:hypothetical protein
LIKEDVTFEIQKDGDNYKYNKVTYKYYQDSDLVNKINDTIVEEEKVFLEWIEMEFKWLNISRNNNNMLWTDISYINEITNNVEDSEDTEGKLV